MMIYDSMKMICVACCWFSLFEFHFRALPPVFLHFPVFVLNSFLILFYVLGRLAFLFIPPSLSCASHYLSGFCWKAWTHERFAALKSLKPKGKKQKKKKSHHQTPVPHPVNRLHTNTVTAESRLDCTLTQKWQKRILRFILFGHKRRFIGYLKVTFQITCNSVSSWKHSAARIVCSSSMRQSVQTASAIEHFDRVVAFFSRLVCLTNAFALLISFRFSQIKWMLWVAHNKYSWEFISGLNCISVLWRYSFTFIVMTAITPSVTIRTTMVARRRRRLCMLRTVLNGLVGVFVCVLLNHFCPTRLFTFPSVIRISGKRSGDEKSFRRFISFPFNGIYDCSLKMNALNHIYVFISNAI